MSLLDLSAKIDAVKRELDGIDDAIKAAMHHRGSLQVGQRPRPAYLCVNLYCYLPKSPSHWMQKLSTNMLDSRYTGPSGRSGRGARGLCMRTGAVGGGGVRAGGAHR